MPAQPCEPRSGAKWPSPQSGSSAGSTATAICTDMRTNWTHTVCPMGTETARSPQQPRLTHTRKPYGDLFIGAPRKGKSSPCSPTRRSLPGEFSCVQLLRANTKRQRQPVLRTLALPHPLPTDQHPSPIVSPPAQSAHVRTSKYCSYSPSSSSPSSSSSLPSSS